MLGGKVQLTDGKAMDETAILEEGFVLSSSFTLYEINSTINSILDLLYKKKGGEL